MWGLGLVVTPHHSGLCSQGLDREVILLVPPSGCGVNTSWVSPSPGSTQHPVDTLLPPAKGQLLSFSLLIFFLVRFSITLYSKLISNKILLPSPLSAQKTGSHSSTAVSIRVCTQRPDEDAGSLLCRCSSYFHETASHSWNWAGLSSPAILLSL